jgi:photosynthetic reaction center cytochrome c subunit
MHNARRGRVWLRYSPQMRRILIAIALLITISTAHAEQKNVQVLTGLSDAELQRYMAAIRASLGVNCDFCHVRKNNAYDFPNDAKKEKETARDMIQMTEKLNREQFGGRATISCNTCHRGSPNPVALVALPQPLPPHAADERPPRPTLPALDDIVKRYTAAVGDASKLLSAQVLKGTRDNWDGKSSAFTLEESAGKVHITSTTAAGPVEQWVNPVEGWSRDAKGVRRFNSEQIDTVHQLINAYEPVPPSAIPTDARVVTKEKIGDRETYVVVARLDDTTRERLYFDTTSGLLVRRMVIKDTPIGPIPQQTDYEDYRETGGTKYPFTVKISLVDPFLSSTRHYSEVQLGAKLDEEVFTPPAGSQPSS